MHFDHEEDVILSLDNGYILISKGLLPPLEEGQQWSGASSCEMPFARNVSLWAWHIFTHAHQKSSHHVSRPVCFEFGSGYSLGS